jgi:O-acetyl-ADP-ribose deacetylase (regulator of RNase III)
MHIKYTIGDATQPQGDGLKIIAHVSNSIGGWGRGFVVALSKRWPAPEAAFRKWHKELGSDLPLGEAQFVPVENDVIVVNMIGQHGIYPDSEGRPPVRYEAIRACLAQICTYALENKASVHAPRFGAGLAGGNWDMIEGIIQEELCDKGVEVTIYDLAAA